MKRYSLRRRLIAAVLLLECALVAGLSGAALLYLWREHMRSFDVMVRGRADSLLGQVHDAEDAGDNVAIDAEALDLRGRDLWMARDEGGRGAGAVGGLEQRCAEQLWRETGSARFSRAGKDVSRADAARDKADRRGEWQPGHRAAGDYFLCRAAGAGR
jgi:hypothetical protein